jgi:hypothetical protein
MCRRDFSSRNRIGLPVLAQSLSGRAPRVRSCDSQVSRPGVQALGAVTMRIVGSRKCPSIPFAALFTLFHNHNDSSAQCCSRQSSCADDDGFMHILHPRVAQLSEARCNAIGPSLASLTTEASSAFECDDDKLRVRCPTTLRTPETEPR